MLTVKKKKRTFSGVKKSKATVVWKSLIKWFIDVRTNLTVRLKSSIFRL